ncbi:hypothetical protein LSH36_175g05082 [Paralvinella palmiformis]|uniref:Uncharacterized protein n=1 Tax=Paralvinella palmiformis TaxID=53620 RepID=A0AAD9JRM4_9ANNE|nr:hypothetical protein LSH36_175g05082 [Paralvinella palmiformis]
MMSDTTFLSPSPWMNDLSLMKDGLLSECDTLTDLPFDTLGSDLDREDIQSLTSWVPELRVPSTYQDSEVSVTNSDCSDVQSVDIDVNLEDALLQNLCSTDFLSSAIISSNQRSCSLQPVQWSSLNSQEQCQLVEDLSKIVSKQLGLREQLEVIHIISPETSLSPTDTEFIIDLSCLDDDKLERVFAFMSSNTKSSSSQQDNDNSKCTQNQQGHRSKHHSGRSVRHVHHENDFHSENMSDSKISCRKARKRSHKQLANRCRSKTQYKRERQQLKEQRSGLFVKEQIVAVETSEVGEVDDVDILT